MILEKEREMRKLITKLRYMERYGSVENGAVKIEIKEILQGKFFK